MKTKAEGIRRLSLLLGILGIVFWVIIAIDETSGFTKMNKENLLIFLIGLPICFIIPWFSVKVIYWVFLGFKSDSNKS